MNEIVSHLSLNYVQHTYRYMGPAAYKMLAV